MNRPCFWFCLFLMGGAGSAVAQKDTSRVQLKEAEVRGKATATRVTSKSIAFETVLGQGELRKAACCNLSESFETNPSIDASFSDAVSGTRQIELFGLSGKYAQIQTEMVPLVRGLWTAQGMSFVPGTWIESIQLTKGIGSIANGYESMTGQINVELHKPAEVADGATSVAMEGKGDVRLNAYINQSARTEVNAIAARRFSKRWSGAFLGHVSTRPKAMDNNGDGFMDNPLGFQANGLWRAQWEGPKGWEGHYSLHLVTDSSQGGQMSESQPNASNRWRAGMHNQRIAFTAKTGWVDEHHPDRSVGTIVSVSRSSQRTAFGSPAMGFLQAKALQNSALVQLLYRTGNSPLLTHTRGISWQADAYTGHLFSAIDSTRWESVPGTFWESTWTPSSLWTIVPGLRVDYHSVYGLQWTPRLHVRFAPAPRHTLRFAVGRGWRSSLPWNEQVGLYASNRDLIGNRNWDVQPWMQEVSWNTGLSYVWLFTLNHRIGTFSAEANATRFTSLVIHDLFTPTIHEVYAVSGSLNNPAGASTAFSSTVDYSLSKFIDVRLAYKYQNVWSMTNGHPWSSVGLQPTDNPFVSRHRGMVNVAYTTHSQWVFDATAQLYGPKAIPAKGSDGLPFDPWTSPAYTLVHGQITKKGKNWDVYVGVENALNVQQEQPIVSAAQPASPLFDATLVWGPIFGRMFYMGTHLSL